MDDKFKRLYEAALNIGMSKDDARFYAQRTIDRETLELEITGLKEQLRQHGLTPSAGAGGANHGDD